MGFYAASDGPHPLDRACRICRQGQYSSSDTSYSCTDCPDGQITSLEGSTNSSQCLAGRELTFHLLQRCFIFFSELEISFDV